MSGARGSLSSPLSVLRAIFPSRIGHGHGLDDFPCLVHRFTVAAELFHLPAPSSASVYRWRRSLRRLSRPPVASSDALRGSLTAYRIKMNIYHYYYVTIKGQHIKNSNTVSKCEKQSQNTRLITKVIVTCVITVDPHLPALNMKSSSPFGSPIDSDMR